MLDNKPVFLESGEPARLIPIIPDSSREQKSASVFLSGLRSVYEFRQAMLASISVKVGTNAKLDAWTEIVFKMQDKNLPKVKDRPDGLLILRTGKREWRALIEAKVGSEEIKEDQITKYLQQAKHYGLDAVITISNQFTAIPSHHPVKLNKNLTKSVDLFHWSWAYIVTQCQLLISNKNVNDEDQNFILQEILRYFLSDRSGVTSFGQMNPEWKEVVNKVRSKACLTKTSSEVQNTIAAWHQEQKDLCLLLSRETSSEVTLKLKNAHRLDPALRIKEDAEAFCKDQVLVCTIDIPNTAAPLEVCADLERRMIFCSMRLTAPKDKKSTKARLNWLLRQLKDTKAVGFYIRATRPGKAQPTYEPIAVLREWPEKIESDSGNATATAFEVVYEAELAAKFVGRRVFIEELEIAVPHFYAEAGQYLKAWVAPPPKIQKPDEDSDEITQEEPAPNYAMPFPH